MAKVVKGIVKGKVVVLEEELPVPDGTEVEVHIPEEALPRKGSPQALLQLRGLLTPEEAEEILKAIKETDVPDWEP